MKEELKNIILSQSILKIDNLEDYIDKIFNYATIIPYFQVASKGYIAYYTNDIHQKDAFLTLIIVKESAQGEGIGTLLLKASISDLKQRNFQNFRLEVLKENKKAVEFYFKYGFEVEKDMGNSILMKLILR